MKLPAAPSDFWSLSETERDALGIAQLPASLGEALDRLQMSKEVRSWFGEALQALYLQFKRSEIEALGWIRQRYVSGTRRCVDGAKFAIPGGEMRFTA